MAGIRRLNRRRHPGRAVQANNRAPSWRRAFRSKRQQARRANTHAPVVVGAGRVLEGGSSADGRVLMIGKAKMGLVGGTFLKFVSFLITKRYPGCRWVPGRSHSYVLAALCWMIPACQGVAVRETNAHRSLRGAQPRNLLLISVDTLRADHLGCYGYTRQTSSAIDALARHGCLLTNAFAASAHTAPSHMSIFTSQYPFEHGVRSQSDGVLSSAASTLAEAFQQAGYETAAFVGNSGPRFRFGPDVGHARGFLTWEYPNRFFALNARIRPWLEAHRETPFFLFVHAGDPHERVNAAAEEPAAVSTLTRTLDEARRAANSTAPASGQALLRERLRMEGYW